MLQVNDEKEESAMGAETLLSRIEELRHLLYSVAKDKRLADPEVVHLSQKLDILLNHYAKTARR